MSILLHFSGKEKSLELYAQDHPLDMLRSDGTVYLARSEAACAYGSFSYSAVIVDPYGLDISVPFSFCMDVGVRNSISRCLTLAAYFTFSGHLPHLLIVSCLSRFRKPCNTNTSISQNASTFFAHFSMLYICLFFFKFNILFNFL